jgi:hypothetical protein
LHMLTDGHESAATARRFLKVAVIL